MVEIEINKKEQVKQQENVNKTTPLATEKPTITPPLDSINKSRGLNQSNSNVNISVSPNKPSFTRFRKSNRRKSWKSQVSEFTEEVICTRRVSKTTGGGKRLRFSAVVVVGNGKGRIGYATGKAKETPDAIRKAIRSALKNTIQIHFAKNATIVHDVEGKAASTHVQLRSARSGKGIVAGGPVRIIMQLAGIENISTKIHGPKNELNAIRATFNALKKIETKEDVMARRKDDIEWMKPEPLKPLIRIKAKPQDKEGGSREHRTSHTWNKGKEEKEKKS